MELNCAQYTVWLLATPLLAIAVGAVVGLLGIWMFDRRERTHRRVLDQYGNTLKWERRDDK